MNKCDQTKCCYHIDNGLNMAMQCPVCKECGVDPNLLSENCTTCYNCSKDAGILRGNKPQLIIQIKQIKQKVKQQCPQLKN